MAFEKLSVPQSVVDQSIAHAHLSGRSAAMIALRQMEPYAGPKGVFTQQQVEAYAQRKNEEAQLTWLEERIVGKHNDKVSRKPGLTALVRAHAKERMEIVFKSQQQLKMHEVEIDRVEDAPTGQPLYTVRIPEGGFVELTETTLEFTDLVEEVATDLVRPIPVGASSVRVGILDVVTIAGDAGEYWQSPHYNIDGTFSR